MNNEIKEILYVLKHIVIGRASRLTSREADKLLDYITNLQEQLHKASLDIQELTERDLMCPTSCDKLTNLQEENERLKKKNRICRKSPLNIKQY